MKMLILRQNVFYQKHNLYILNCFHVDPAIYLIFVVG